MVFICVRRAEQRENPVAGGLHHIAVVTAHGTYHEIQGRVDERPCLFRVKVAQQLGGVLDICKKCSDRLALAVKDVTSTVCCRYLNLWQRLVRLRWLGGMSTSRRNQSGAAFSAEFFVPLDG